MTVESDTRLHWFCFTTLSDWLNEHHFLNQSGKKNKSNRDLHAHVFWRFVPGTCISFEF